MSRRNVGRLVLGGFLVALAAARLDAACDRGLITTCERSTCATPAVPAPASLWNELRASDVGPLPAERDTTDFNEFTTLYYNRNWFMGVDVENGWVIAGLAHGIGVWDARADTDVASFVSVKRYGPSQTVLFPYIPSGEASKIVFGAVDAPSGVDTLAAVAGYNGAGILLFDLRDKTKPRAIYQNAGKTSEAVYAARLAGTNYAFLGSQTPAGVWIYDMDRALANSPTGQGCLQDDAASPTACAGVRIGSLPGLSAAGYYLHGAGDLLAIGHGASRGLSVYSVANPTAPELRALVLNGSAGYPVYGVAMWQHAGKTYVGARLGTKNLGGGQLSPEQLQIYDVTACGAGACTPLLVGSHPYSTSGQSQYLTASADASGKPFLYLGSDATCGSNSAQTLSGREFLLDVADPAAPVDVMPTATLPVTATYSTGEVTKNVSYWSWYERESPSGYNLVAPRVGKFNGNRFYRAARSILDFHRKSRTPLFTNPATATVDIGAPVALSVTAIGIPLPTISLQTGDLPSGLNYIAGQIVGVANPGTGGAYPLTFVATNGLNPAATQLFQLEVRQAPEFNSVASARFAVGVANTFTVTATGYPAPPISLHEGTLPQGLTFSNGVLAGTPTGSGPSSVSLTFRADNGVGDAALQEFTLEIEQAPAFVSGATVFFGVAVSSSFAPVVTGVPPPAVALDSGALPGGVLFADGLLSGTPGAGTEGSYPLRFRADNGVAPAATQDFSLVVGVAGFHTVVPCRLFDSRGVADAPALASGTSRSVAVAGHCGVPATAKAVSVNFTTVAPSGSGVLQAFAADQLSPDATVVSFGAGSTRANSGIVQLALNATGALALRATLASGGTVHVVLDVNGYFE